MNTISIRQAALADIEALSVLFDGYRQFYGRESDVPAAKKFLIDRFGNGESILFIAHDGAEPIGFTQLYPSFSSVSLGRIYVLNDLFVNELGRRKGVGAKLLTAAADFARAVGAIRLALSTSNTNTTAQALYEAEGWERDDDFFYTYSTKQ
ncbi:MULTISPECIES: GNAT family N-acetyltransferase [unclassified Duganella]|uniref:GNAT family N-acetyltransferase n=1 Tax=unclassified Duganella TaxID=2636909 RepID=UPI000E345E85|nr:MULTISPECIES: GNAT family N-acetyltransferase [unclassified Duganella]RFP16394.1 GNAT family N-acetyltransferase [Duganella sp. BJB475]RFP33146.1 GNAT family N-acetyltransferase [Duganella sp. BJB476]